MLEICSKQNDQVVTRLNLEEKSRPAFNLDAIGTQSNFAVQFGKLENRFIWLKFDMQRQFYHMQCGCIT